MPGGVRLRRGLQHLLERPLRRARFRRPLPAEQLRRYGLLGTVALWVKMFRFGVDVGHFLWARPGPTKPDNPGLQWWAGTLASALIFLLAGWRSGRAEELDAVALLGAVSAVLALFGLREAAMRLAARWRG